MSQFEQSVRWGILWMGSLVGVGQAVTGDTALHMASSSMAEGLEMTVTVDLSRLTLDASGALRLPGCETLNEPGRWALPVKTLPVVLPAGMTVKQWEVHVEGMETRSLAGLSLRGLPREHEEIPNALPVRYPLEMVVLSPAETRHGIRTSDLSIHPVQMEPASGLVSAAPRFTIRLTWGPAAEAPEITRPFVNHPAAQRRRKELAVSAVNGAEIARGIADPLTSPAVDAPTYHSKSPTGRLEGVIICPANTVTLFAQLADEKTRSGTPWEVVTYEWIYAQPEYRQGTHQDEAAAIHHFLQESYRTYGLEYVIFGGTPPVVPVFWENYGLTADNWYQALGYYTNLDQGHHDRVIETRSISTLYLTVQDPLLFPQNWRRFRSVNTHEDRAIVLNSRCGAVQSRIMPESVGFYASPVFQSTQGNLALLSAWAVAHPEMWGQEFVYSSNDYLFRSAGCDLSPELYAGWVPVHPVMGRAGVGLYLAKLGRYQEPVAPERLATFLNEPWHMPDRIFGTSAVEHIKPSFDVAGLTLIRYVDSGDPSVLMNEYRAGVGSAWIHQCPGEGLSRFMMGVSAPASSENLWQPSGLLVYDVCLSDVARYGSSSGWPAGGSLWNRPLANVVVHPEGGPVATMYNGVNAVEPSGPAPWGGLGDFPSLGFGFSDRVVRGVPLGRLIDLYRLNDWNTAHRSIFVGDPTLKLWTRPPTRLVVEKPAMLSSEMAITVKNTEGAPVPGAFVTVSKRRLDGTYSLYQSQPTNEAGVATMVLPGLPGEWGTGTVALEIGRFTAPGHLDYYPYHDAWGLRSGNQPPVIQTNIPKIVPVDTNSTGGWVVLDAGETTDPDGDSVRITWRWTDYRTGTPVVMEATGRYVRVFLPVGRSTVTVMASDGVASVTHHVEVVIDRFKPRLTARAPVMIPPSSGWVAVPIRVVSPSTPVQPGALEFEGEDVDPLAPDVTGAMTWEVMGISSTDPVRPAPASFSLSGTTLWVKAELNGDASIRCYRLTAQAVDLAGLKSPLRMNQVVIAPIGSTLLQGTIQGYSEMLGEGVPEPGVLVELQTLDGRWVTRTQTGTNGTWQLYAPSLTGPGTGYHFRASKGGRDFRYHLESLTLGNGTLLPESWTTGPAGLTLAYKNTLDWDDRLTVSVARLVTNRPPIARVAHPTLEVVSSTSSTLVTLDGRLSSDPDRDLLQGYWFWSNNPERLSYSYPGLLTQGPFPQGVTEVELWVSDGTAESRTRFYVWVHPSVDPTGASGGAE